MVEENWSLSVINAPTKTAVAAIFVSDCFVKGGICHCRWTLRRLMPRTMQ
jgi:hypothetical protein